MKNKFTLCFAQILLLTIVICSLCSFTLPPVECYNVFVYELDAAKDEYYNDLDRCKTNDCKTEAKLYYYKAMDKSADKYCACGGGWC